MDRMARILRGLDKTMLGLEIAPWFAPIAPKSTGYNVRVLDVFDRPTLLARAKLDPDLVNRDMSLVEEVDFVGSATEIGAIIPEKDLGTFDYIVSSHNFEHLANPIKFLQGCAKVLKPGGLLSIVVPDRRGCFDYFRPNTQLGDWLDAYATNRDRPLPRQVFDLKSNLSYFQDGPRKLGAFSVGETRSSVMLSGNLTEAYKKYYLDPLEDGYHDAHCTVMTPASLEMLLTETQYLGFVDFTIEEVSATVGCEIFVRLRFGQSGQKPTEEEFHKQRQALQHRVLQDYVLQLIPVRSDSKRLFKTTPLTRKIRGFGRYLRGKPDH